MDTNRVCTSATTLALVLVSGCATIVTGASEGVTVESDPSGATCSVARGQEQLAAISATPAQVTLTKGWSDLAVDCKKEGNATSKITVPSSFQPWTLGNILLGGVIGIAIDAASGAITEYPKVITLFLAPSEFSSEQERDTYFEQRKAGIESEAAKAAEEVRNKFRTFSGLAGPAVDMNCETPACMAAIKPIEDRKRLRLAAVETQKASVRVSSRQAGLP
jgi:hypothetical protein